MRDESQNLKGKRAGPVALRGANDLSVKAEGMIFGKMGIMGSMGGMGLRDAIWVLRESAFC